MTDTPTPPMMLKQRAGLVDWLRHPCAETPDLDANDMATAADQLEADGVTIATLTADRDGLIALAEDLSGGLFDANKERDAAQAEIARLTAALATAREDGMREAAMCFDAIAHATPAQSPKHMAANYRDRFLDIITKGAAT